MKHHLLLLASVLTLSACGGGSSEACDPAHRPGGPLREREDQRAECQHCRHVLPAAVQRQGLQHPLSLIHI